MRCGQAKNFTGSGMDKKTAIRFALMAAIKRSYEENLTGETSTAKCEFRAQKFAPNQPAIPLRPFPAARIRLRHAMRSIPTGPIGGAEPNRPMPGADRSDPPLVS
jgi:hypothetical protein